MSKQVVALFVVLGVGAGALATGWQLGPPVVIDAVGTRPSLWNGTIAYTLGNGGGVWFYDGVGTSLVFSPATQCYEPVNANGALAWRNYSPTAGNEIYRWCGGAPSNISNSPDNIDCDLAAASNGDLMWSQDHAWLMYYHASSGQTEFMNIRGIWPSPYYTAGGTVTYAYQDPDTREVKYFDGSTTRTIGMGTDGEGARTSLWNGAVAWVGGGVGSELNKLEIYHWRNGQMTRVTNDDAVNGKQDNYPRAWRNLVVWARCVSSSSQPRMMIWDGVHTVQLTTTRTNYPSFHDGKIAFVEYTLGLELASLVPPTGDCDLSGMVDLPEFLGFEQCLGGPGSPSGSGCTCSDLGGDNDVDVADFSVLQVLFGQ